MPSNKTIIQIPESLYLDRLSTAYTEGYMREAGADPDKSELEKINKRAMDNAIADLKLTRRMETISAGPDRYCNNLKITVYKNDDLDGFGCYLSPVDKENIWDEKNILINVEACLISAIEYDDSFKNIMIETLMHEFGHALEDVLGLELTEDRVEGIVESYRAKYLNQAPESQ